MSSSTNLLRVEWEAPSYPPVFALDAVIHGQLFAADAIDTNVDRYEVERLDELADEYVFLGYTYQPFIEFQADVYENAKVRIRSILRDGTQTPWVYSGNFQLYGMVADFRNLNNIPLLSFI